MKRLILKESLKFYRRHRKNFSKLFTRFILAIYLNTLNAILVRFPHLHKLVHINEFCPSRTNWALGDVSPGVWPSVGKCNAP